MLRYRTHRGSPVAVAAAAAIAELGGRLSVALRAQADRPDETMTWVRRITR